MKSIAKPYSSLLLEGSAQVLLFHGPRGIGKGALALQLAQSLLKSSKDHHPDLHILYPDPESDQHLIASIRQLIAETHLPPFEAPCKVFILHDAEKMLPASSNALLKTLEEPPADTHFILITSDPAALLPTVLSRCSRVPCFATAPSLDLKKSGLAEKLLCCTTYVELHQLLASQNDLPSAETDSLFEEILKGVRESQRLEEMIPLVAQARVALLHNVKLKNVLEWIFVQYLFQNSMTNRLKPID